MVSKDAHPSGIDAAPPDPRAGIPTPLLVSFRLWLLAVAAGLFETTLVVVDATDGEVGSAAQLTVGVASRLLAFAGLAYFATQLRRGHNWARVALAVLYGGARHSVAGDRPSHLAGRGRIAGRRRGGRRLRLGAVCGRPGRAPGGGHRGTDPDVPPGRQRLHPSNHAGSRAARDAAGKGRRRGQMIDVAR
jgi:hypothetical protein